MASFLITQQDLLVMSVTVHVCIFVELLANRMVGWLVPMFSERSSMVRTLMDISKQRPGLLAKVLMEQITLWIIIVLILVALTYTSVSVKPFGHQPLPYPRDLIRVILSANVARFSVMASRIVLVRDTVMYQSKSVTTPGHSGNSILDFVYNVISASTNLVCLGFHENLLLVLTAAFMELSSTPVECCRLIEQSKKGESSRSYRKTTILSCAVCFMCRILLPLLFLSLASRQESPFIMDEVPLIYFFISGVFYFSFNILLFYQSVKRMRISSHESSSQNSPHSSSVSIPFSIHVSSNDMVESKVKADSDQCHTKDLNSENDHCSLKDFNYDTLRSCDSKNIYYALGSDDVEEVNDSKRKMVKYSTGDIINKLRFNRYTSKDLEKTGSSDLLLGSQDYLLGSQDYLLGSQDLLLGSQKSGVFTASLDNEYSSCQQSEINECNHDQQSQITECYSYQNSETHLAEGLDCNTNMHSHFISSHRDTLEDKTLATDLYRVSGHTPETSALFDTGQCKAQSGSVYAFYSINQPREYVTECEDCSDSIGASVTNAETELPTMCKEQSV